MTPVERLLSLEQFGIKLGLDNIRVLLRELGHPEAASPSVHIAGTNGKGSVAAMVERGLRASGLRTGRYTSPHLSTIEERVAIDGLAIDTAVFASVTRDVLDLVDRAVERGLLTVTPTFFEVSTAIAFDIFRRERVDAAVVEVGLGGRFDATNTLTPAVTAITSIAFDHERHLGSSLKSIAFEKAGIAKPAVPLVVGRMPAEADAAIGDVAAQIGAPVIHAYEHATVATTMVDGRATVTLSAAGRSYPPARLALAGRHQVDNAVVAVRLLEAWSERVSPVSAEAVVAGLATCDWPGRLEWLRLPRGEQLLVDAAHNPSGAAALADYVRDAGVAPLPIVFAAMRDKDVDGMLSPLAPIASRFIATTVRSARARDAQSLAIDIMRIAPGHDVTVESSPDTAVARALRDGGRAVVAGSIFLIGPLRGRLMAAGARPL